MKCPCKGCTDRTVTCHAMCERFEAWRKMKDEAIEARARMNENAISRKGLRAIWKGMRYGRRG